MGHVMCILLNGLHAAEPNLRFGTDHSRSGIQAMREER